MIYKRILVVRTDRLGDVVLSTPVLKALRITYPKSFIAMMVSPYTQDIVKGNPYIDEVIVYDKDHLHASWFNSAKFALRLKKSKFDLAVILHPTNRVHILTFFAGIKRRIGYDRKLSFLLTDKIKHLKKLGQKHEIEYCLDMLKTLNINSEDKSTHVVITKEAEDFVVNLLKSFEVSSGDRFLAVNPGASCPSRIWPVERFAKVSDILTEKYKFKVFILGGPKEESLGMEVAKHMKSDSINLSGKLSVSQLAALIKKCDLLISNDSGPVHVACALGTAVISIFSRNQPGLHPRRFAPQGKKSVFLHKQVGCVECIAHDCIKGFACLKAITVEDVVATAEKLLADTR